MSILWRYLAKEYLKAFLATLGGLVTIWLIIDYVDQSKHYSGANWWKSALALYFYKTIAVFQELAPGSLLLAAGITMAGLVKRGEHTALRALAVGPTKILGPILVVSLLIAGGLVIADDLIVGKARQRIDEINAQVFHRYGNWELYYGEVRWFSGKNHIFHLRQTGPDDSFIDVTIFRVSPDFRLSQRIDAQKMEPLGGRRWRLHQGTQRDFFGKRSTEEKFTQKELELDETPSSFRILKGRPEQMRLKEIREQMEIRKKMGLTSDRYLFALHNKFAYPLAGLPGALLACALALRPGRRNYLVSAFMEGFVTIIVLWGLMVVFKAASLSGLVYTPLAAWAPMGMLALASAVSTWRLFK